MELHVNDKQIGLSVSKSYISLKVIEFIIFLFKLSTNIISIL